MRLSSWLTAFTNPITGFIPGLRQARTRRKPVGTKLENLEDRTLLTVDLLFAADTASLAEGNGASTDFTFTVTRSGDTNGQSTIDYVVTGSVTNPADANDFVGAVLPSGTVTFAPGVLSQTITISVVGDNIVELNEGFTVTLSNFNDSDNTPGVIPAPQSSSITNDDTATISIDSVTQNENGTFTFTITSSNPSDRDLTVTVNTANGTATAGSDYTARSGDTFTIPGDGSTTTVDVVVAVNSDAIVEDDETFNVNLSAPLYDGVADGARAVLGTASGLGTITNDDIATISIGNVTQTESGTFTFTITSSNPSAKALTGTINTANGTATAGSDYTAISGGTFTIAGDGTSTTTTVTVTVNNDSIVEDDETFNVNLSAPLYGGATDAGRAALGTASGLGTITNNDTATISIDSVTQNENGTFTFTITSSNPSAKALTGTIDTANGTATAGSDYTAISGGTFTIAGDGTSTTTTVTVTVNSDAIVEDDETFNVNLSAALYGGATDAGRATLGTASGLGTITNDDTATISIGNVTQNENGTFTFTITSSNPSAKALTGTINTANGTATAGSDYTAISGGTFTIAGDGTSTTTTVTVTVNDDAIVEDNETFNVNLSAPLYNGGADGTRATLGTASGLGTITNNDVATISIGDVTQNENGTFTFTITSSNPSAKDLTGTINTANGTATAGSDYTAISGGTFTIVGDGTSTTTTVTVTVNDDVIVEDNETFNVNLSAPLYNGGADSTRAILGAASALGTITNNDLATISIGNVTQNENGTFTFTITSSNPSAKDLTGTINTANGTATAGSDYTAISGGTFTIVGDGTSTSTTVTVTVNNDAIVEDDETFNVNLSSPLYNGGADATRAILGTASGLGTITNNDTATISIGNVTQNENGTFTFTITSSNPSSKNLTGTINTANGTATAGSDYTAISGGTFTIVGDGTSTTTTVTVTVNNDAVVEDDETFNVNLSAPLYGGATDAGRAALGTASGLGTITNNDIATISIGNVTQNENGTFTFTITSSNPSVKDLTGTINTANGTATAGSDYTAISGGTFTIVGDGTSTTTTVTVTVNDDLIVEDDETFNVNLSAPLYNGGTDATRAILGTASGLGTITNNDQATISIGNVTQNENGTFTFTITSDLASAKALTGTINTANGTATAGSDYTAISGGTFTIPGDGVTKTTTVTVTVNDDVIVEDDETFNVNLTAALYGGATDATRVVLGTASGLGTITNNDTATISIGDVTANENGTFTFTITSTNPSSRNLTGTINTADGTATLAGLDYTQISGGTFTILGNGAATTTTVTVTVNNDTLVEGTENFNVNLTSPLFGGGVDATRVVMGDGSAVGTITDNDTAVITFTSAGNSVSEGGTATSFTVTLTITANGVANTGTLDRAVSFDVTDAVTGTATSGGVDYTFATQSYSFPIGTASNSSKIVNVGISEDLKNEGNETAVLQFSNLSDGSGGQVTTSGLHTVTINDNDTATTVVFNAPTGNGTDAFRIVLNGANLEFYDNGVLIDSRAMASITTLTIQGADNENDTLNVDLTGGDIVPSGGIFFNGGNGTGLDALTITGGSQGTVTYNYTNAHDGSVVMSAFGTVNYVGLEPITNTGTASDIIFNLPGTADATISLSDLVAGTSARLQSTVPTFELTDFAIPVAGGSITINLGDNNQTFTLSSLTLNANTDLIVDGGNGTDTIHLNAAGLSITDALTLTAETIDQANAVTVAGLTTLNAGAAGTISLALAGNNFNTLAITSANTASIKDDGGFVVAGATATTSITLESAGGTVTQTAAITAPTLTLQGAAGAFNLGTQNNAVTTLDADNSALASLNFKDDTGYAVAGINSSGAVTLESVGGTVTQTALIAATTLTLQGTGGTFNLGSQNNAVTTLDANTSALAALAFKDDTGYDVAGATASGAITLESAGGTVTQSAVISGTTLTLQGAAGTFNLGSQNNAITTLDANNATLAALTFKDDTGYSVAGATASGAITLESAGGTVTQSAVISGTTLTLQGAGGTFTLGTQNNAVTTLDADNTTLAALTFKDDTGYDVAGATATGAITLDSAGGTVTQSGVISGTTLTLQGTGGTFSLGSQNNAVTTLDANNLTLAALTFKDDTGYVVAGATASGAITLESAGGTVTQTAVISGTTLTLQGAGGTFTLNSQNNAVTTLDANNTSLAALSFKDDTGYDVAGATATGTVTLESVGGTVTESAAITGTTLTLQGANGTFSLGSQNNDVTTLDANNSTLTALSFRDDNGFDVAGVQTSGNTTLSSTGAVTQSAVITAAGLELLGAGGTFTLNSQNNAVTTLAGNTGTVLFQDNTGFAIGTVNTAGLTATTAATLTSTGTVTQTQPITTPTLTLTGANGTFSLGSQNNAVTTLDANNSTLNTLTFRDDTGFDVAGATMTGSLTLNASTTGAITQSALISAGTTNLTGGAITLTLANVLGDLTVNAGTGAVSITENDAIVVAGITHSNGDLTLQAGANSITVNGPINITTGNANFLTTTTLNLNNNVTATTILGTPITVNVNNNTAQIQDGVDAAAAGATVNVNSGVTFAEHVSVPKNLSLVATVNGVTINSPTANPALTVTAGAVNATGFSLTSTTAADTVLVSGGSLKLRNNFIVESSTATQVAIRVSAGTLDLGVTATAEPGNNSITTSGGGTLLNTATPVDASGNWWGSSTFATITAGLSGSVDYSPYLNGGADTSIAVGFQGDFSDVTAHAQGSQAGVGAITEAYQMLANTGTIHVLTGSYTESVDLGAGVNKAVTLAAGASPGQVQISGGLTFTSNDTLPVELNGTSTSLFDSFDVAGTVDLGNANLVVTVGYGAVPYDRFTIINKSSAGAVTGTFNGLGEGAIIQVPGGPRLRISYIEFHNTGSTPPTPVFYGDGNDVSLTVMLPPILVTFQNGNLTLDGTGWNDDITLVFTGTNTVTLIGNDVTNFTGPGTGNAQLAGPYIVTGNIKVNLGNGNDKVLIRGVGGAARFDSGNLTIDMGNDDDTVTTIDNALVPIATTGLTMTGNLSILGGAGNDTVTLGSIAAADFLTALNVNVDTGTGNGLQSISLDRVTANGSVTLANGGTGAQSVTLGSVVANSITGGLTINQQASATSYTVAITDTSVGGNLLITNGSGPGAASVTIDTTAARTVGGLTQITNGNNLTNAVSLNGTAGALRLAGNITVKNGNATTSNTITVTDLVNSGSTSSSFTNGLSPANLITFDGGLGTPFNTFVGVVAATNGNSTGTNVINATRLSSTKGINLTNGTATTSNDVSVGGAGIPNAVAVTGNLVIANGASADIDVDIDNLTTFGAPTVGDVTITNAASGAGGTTVTFGAIAANTISGNVKITNQASTGLRSVVIDQTAVNGRTGVNVYEVGAGNTSLTVGVTAAATIANILTVQDGNGTGIVNLHQLTAGGFNYTDLGGGIDVLNLANNAGGNLQINGVTRIDTGAANDIVNIATNGIAFFNDSVFISLGAGNDLLFIGANADSPAFNGSGKFQFDGGAGTDVFNASPLSLADYFGDPLGKKVKSKIVNFESLLTN